MSADAYNWAMFAPFAERLRAKRQERPAAVAVSDANSAAFRDVLDDFGLQITDERTIFCACVAASLVGGVARSSLRAGVIDAAAYEAISSVIGTFIEALADYFPDEVGR